MLTFGQLIKTARKKARLKQREVAELAGNICTTGYISNIERNADVGKKGYPGRPGIEIVDALADALNIPRKIARDAANYASPEDETGGSGQTGQELSVLFSNYERLDPKNRGMALTLISGLLNNLYELQSGSSVLDSISSVDQPVAATVGKKVPLIYASEREKITQEVIQFSGKEREIE